MNPLKPTDGIWDISANRLYIFMSCPKKLILYLTHQDDGDTDTKYIDAGQAIHDYMEHHFNGDDVPIEDLIEKHGVIDEMVPRVMTCVEHAEKYLSLKGTPEMAEEKVFTTPKGRTVNMVYRIDLQCEDADIDGVGKKVVIDWKSGKDVNKPEYILQMQVYRFVRDFKYDALLVSLLTGATLPVTKSAEDYIPKLCDRYIDAIESLEFDANPQYLCRYCPYHDNFCTEEHKYDLIVPKMTWDDTEKKWVE